MGTPLPCPEDGGTVTTIERAYVQTSGGQLHLRASGAGPVLVLLHQTAMSGRFWQPIMERLTDFRCVAIDTPGFGLSDPPSRLFSMVDYAAVIAEAMRTLGHPRYHLLGHHTGAAIAAQLAADFPEAIDRLVLHACPTGSDEFRARKLEETKPVPLGADGSHIDWVRGRLLGYSTPIPPDELHWLIVEYLSALPEAYGAHRAVWQQRAEELAPRIVAPTLLFTGNDDLFVDWQDEFARTFPNAQSKIVPGGRLVQLEDPDGYATIVGGFLRER